MFDYAFCKVNVSDAEHSVFSSISHPWAKVSMPARFYQLLQTSHTSLHRTLFRKTVLRAALKGILLSSGKYSLYKGEYILSSQDQLGIGTEDRSQKEYACTRD